MLRKTPVLVPLGCYLAVSLGLPLLNGAGGSDGFWEHAGVVFGICGALFVATAVVRWIRRTPQRRSPSPDA